MTGVQTCALPISAATASALGYYAVGLLGYSVVRIASPTFYALGRNRTPVTVSMITVVANATLSILLVRVFGFRGLALGTSLAALFNATVLLTLLRRHLGGLEDSRVLRSLFKIALASAVMGLAAIATNRALTLEFPSGAFVAQATRLGSTIALSLAVLAASAHLLRIQEFHESVSLVLRKLKRT